MRTALEHLRIIDFGQYIAGPLAAFSSPTKVPTSSGSTRPAAPCGTPQPTPPGTGGSGV